MRNRQFITIKVGIIKNEIEKAILDGIIQNDYDAALNYMNEIKKQVLEN